MIYFDLVALERFPGTGSTCFGNWYYHENGKVVLDNLQIVNATLLLVNGSQRIIIQCLNWYYL